MKNSGLCFQFELKKLLIARRGWLIILAAILLQIGLGCFSNPHLYEYSYDTKLYEQYTEVYSGPFKKSNLRKMDVNQIVLDKIMSEQTKPDLSSVDAYEKQSRRIEMASQKSSVLMAIRDKYASFADFRELEPELTYDLELTDYIKRFGMNWASLLCIALLVPLLMLGDKNCGMEQILFPTVTGQARIVRAKLLAACVTGVAVTAVCTLLQWILFSLRWNLGKLDVPVQSITGYAQCSLHSSIGGSLLLSGIVQVLAVPAAVLILCIFSALIRKEVPVVAASVITVAISALLTEKIPGLRVFSIASPLSCMQALAQMSGADLIFMLFFLCLKTTLFAMAAFWLANRKR